MPPKVFFVSGPIYVARPGHQVRVTPFDLQLFGAPVTGLTILLGVLLLVVLYLSATSDDLEPPSNPNAGMRVLQPAYAGGRR